MNEALLVFSIIIVIILDFKFQITTTKLIRP